MEPSAAYPPVKRIEPSSRAAAAKFLRATSMEPPRDDLTGIAVVDFNRGES